MPRRALDHIVGTTAKVRLLRELLTLSTPASGRELERLSNVGHRSARRALDDLVALGVVHRTTTPGVHLYQANRDHDLVGPLESLFLAESARLDSLRKDLVTALETAGLEDRVVSVILFGSAARGDARPDSDLDLLVLVADRSQVADASEFLGAVSQGLAKRFGARTSVLVLPISEARERHREHDPLMRNILEDGRTLVGPPVQEALDTW